MLLSAQLAIWEKQCRKNKEGTRGMVWNCYKRWVYGGAAGALSGENTKEKNFHKDGKGAIQKQQKEIIVGCRAHRFVGARTSNNNKRAADKAWKNLSLLSDLRTKR